MWRRAEEKHHACLMNRVAPGAGRRCRGRLHDDGGTLSRAEGQDSGKAASTPRLLRSTRREVKGGASRRCAYTGVRAARPITACPWLPWGRPSGGAVRPAGAQVPYLRLGSAADFFFLALLLIIAALVAVLLHGARRPVLVRLRLSADGLDRDLQGSITGIEGDRNARASSS